MANLISENNLTPLEQQVLGSLIDNLYAEPGFSDVDAKDISEWTGINKNSMGGILSSLSKKDYVQIDGNSSGYQIIYLNISRWYLHPTWKDSYNYEEWCKRQPLDKLISLIED